MKRIVFYVSGHGFGHATRAAEVIRALGENHPGVRVLVKTKAPKRIFADLTALADSVTASQIDTGVVEAGSSLRVDRQATVAGLVEFMDHRCDEIIMAEAEYVRREKVSLVAADMPYLAGEIAARAGVPCVAIGNFTWDWIYEPYLVENSGGKARLARMRRAYRKMECYLRLPFSHDTDSIPNVVDVPLVTRPVRRAPKDVLRMLGIDDRDPRSRILFAMRGSVLPDGAARAAENSPERLFLYFGSRQQGAPENTCPVILDDRMAFPDVLNVCDAVVSKIGYGTLADCISTRTPLLFPPRSDFREDEVMVPAAPRFLRTRVLPLEDFESGKWDSHLRKLETTAEPIESLEMDGATVCAAILARTCGADS
jgi:L-arabinokinase